MASVLNKAKLTCNARAKNNATVLTVRNETIESMKANINDIDESVSKYAEWLEKEGMPIIDYRKAYAPNDKTTPHEKLISGIKKVMTLNRYHMKKDMKLSGLMNAMVMRKLEEERKQ